MKNQGILARNRIGRESIMFFSGFDNKAINTPQKYTGYPQEQKFTF